MSQGDYSTDGADDSDGFLDDLETWRRQEPIPLERCDLQAIPDDTFGCGWFGSMVDAVSDSLETPIELAGFLGLGVLSAITHGKWCVQVEPGYSEPVTLWLAVPMEPSNRKSSALKMMLAPLIDWEKQQAEQMAPMVGDSISKRKTLEKVIESRRSKCGRLVGNDLAFEIEEIAKMEADLPAVPVVPRVTFHDCTPEELAVLLSQHDERLAFIDSEADSLFEMMLGRYSDSPSLDVYLKSWSGDSMRVDRRTRQAIQLHHPFIALAVAPQPSVIQRLSRKPILVQRGLLARFLFSIPHSKVGFRQLAPVPVDEELRMRYDSGVGSLLDFPAGEHPLTIRLSREAYDCWKSWQREVETMMRPDQRLADSALMAWGGKLAGNTARLAGVLHAAAVAPFAMPHESPVEESTMLRAVAMARTLIDHAIAVHDLAATDENRMRARAILDWLRVHPADDGVVSVRDLQQSLKRRAAFQSANDVRDGVRVLVDAGWLLAAPANDFGRPTEKFFVHPETCPQNPQKSASAFPCSTFGDIGDPLQGMDSETWGEV